MNKSMSRWQACSRVALSEKQAGVVSRRGRTVECARDLGRRRSQLHVLGYLHELLVPATQPLTMPGLLNSSNLLGSRPPVSGTV